MPTIVTHAFVGYAASRLLAPRMKMRGARVVPAVLAMLPDADTALFVFGVAYGDAYGHRGFFHSVFLAVLGALVVAVAMTRHRKAAGVAWWRWMVVLAAAMASHPLADMITKGGLGVAIFSPIAEARFFFPFRVITAAPFRPEQMLSDWGIRVVTSELLWIWMPLIAGMAVQLLILKYILSLRNGTISESLSNRD